MTQCYVTLSWRTIQSFNFITYYFAFLVFIDLHATARTISTTLYRSIDDAPVASSTDLLLLSLHLQMRAIYYFDSIRIALYSRNKCHSRTSGQSIACVSSQFTIYRRKNSVFIPFWVAVFAHIYCFKYKIHTHAQAHAHDTNYWYCYCRFMGFHVCERRACDCAWTKKKKTETERMWPTRNWCEGKCERNDNNSQSPTKWTLPNVYKWVAWQK